jgi:hypothetical protein
MQSVSVLTGQRACPPTLVDGYDTDDDFVLAAVKVRVRVRIR